MDERIVVCEEQEITAKLANALESNEIQEHCDLGAVSVVILGNGEVLVSSTAGKCAIIQPN